jgi:hypothetical protein
LSYNRQAAGLVLATRFHYLTELLRGACMTTKIRKSAKERTHDQVVREQFDAFERQERRIRAQ